MSFHEKWSSCKTLRGSLVLFQQPLKAGFSNRQDLGCHFLHRDLDIVSRLRFVCVILPVHVLEQRLTICRLDYNQIIRPLMQWKPSWIYYLAKQKRPTFGTTSSANFYLFIYHLSMEISKLSLLELWFASVTKWGLLFQKTCSTFWSIPAYIYLFWSCHPRHELKE